MKQERLLNTMAGSLGVQSHPPCYPKYVIYQLQILTGQDCGAVIWSVQMHERPGDGAAPHLTAGACKREVGLTGHV
jgi:hypothetical protein